MSRTMKRLVPLVVALLLVVLQAYATSDAATQANPSSSQSSLGGTIPSYLVIILFLFIFVALPIWGLRRLSKSPDPNVWLKRLCILVLALAIFSVLFFVVYILAGLALGRLYLMYTMYANALMWLLVVVLIGVASYFIAKKISNAISDAALNAKTPDNPDLLDNGDIYAQRITPAALRFKKKGTYAVCFRCHKAMTLGTRNCPWCGADQKAAPKTNNE